MARARANGTGVCSHIPPLSLTREQAQELKYEGPVTRGGHEVGEAVIGDPRACGFALKYLVQHFLGRNMVYAMFKVLFENPLFGGKKRDRLLRRASLIPPGALPAEAKAPAKAKLCKEWLALVPKAVSDAQEDDAAACAEILEEQATLQGEFVMCVEDVEARTVFRFLREALAELRAYGGPGGDEARAKVARYAAKFVKDVSRCAATHPPGDFRWESREVSSARLPGGALRPGRRTGLPGADPRPEPGRRALRVGPGHAVALLAWHAGGRAVLADGVAGGRHQDGDDAGAGVAPHARVRARGALHPRVCRRQGGARPAAGHYGERADRVHQEEQEHQPPHPLRLPRATFSKSRPLWCGLGRPAEWAASHSRMVRGRAAAWRASTRLFVKPHPEEVSSVGVDLAKDGTVKNLKEIGWLPHVLSGAVKSRKVSAPIRAFSANAENFQLLQALEVEFLADSKCGLPAKLVTAFLRDIFLLPAGAQGDASHLEGTVLAKVADYMQQDRAVHRAAHLSMVGAPLPPIGATPVKSLPHTPAVGRAPPR